MFIKWDSYTLINSDKIISVEYAHDTNPKSVLVRMDGTKNYCYIGEMEECKSLFWQIKKLLEAQGRSRSLHSVGLADDLKRHAQWEWDENEKSLAEAKKQLQEDY